MNINKLSNGARIEYVGGRFISSNLIEKGTKGTVKKDNNLIFISWDNGINSKPLNNNNYAQIRATYEY